MAACRGGATEGGDRILILKFANGLLVALASAMLPYGAIVLSFSDPLRDKSFRSKAVVTGFMIVLGEIFTALSLADAWRYFSLWDFKGHQIILQVRLTCISCCIDSVDRNCRHSLFSCSRQDRFGV